MSSRAFFTSYTEVVLPGKSGERHDLFLGDSADRDRIQANPPEAGICPFTGNPSARRVYWAKAY